MFLSRHKVSILNDKVTWFCHTDVLLMIICMQLFFIIILSMNRCFSGCWWGVCSWSAKLLYESLYEFSFFILPLARLDWPITRLPHYLCNTNIDYCSSIFCMWWCPCKYTFRLLFSKTCYEISLITIQISL